LLSDVSRLRCNRISANHCTHNAARYRANYNTNNGSCFLRDNTKYGATATVSAHGNASQKFIQHASDNAFKKSVNLIGRRWSTTAYGTHPELLYFSDYFYSGYLMKIISPFISGSVKITCQNNSASER